MTEFEERQLEIKKLLKKIYEGCKRIEESLDKQEALLKKTEQLREENGW